MPLKFLKKCRQYNVTSKSLFVISVHHLLDTSTTVDCTVSSESKGQECLDNVCQRLLIGQPELFGLRYIVKGKEDEMKWIDLDRPLSRQLEKYAAGTKIFLRVLHYVTTGVKHLSDEVSRYYYFLQLKNDIYEGKIACDIRTAILLALYCRQAEYDSYQTDKHTKDYLKTRLVLPKNLSGLQNDDDLHDTLIGEVLQLNAGIQHLTQSQAEEMYIQCCQQLEGYGEERFSAKDTLGNDIQLGLTINGIVVNSEGGRQYFPWKEFLTVVNVKRSINIEQNKNDVIYTVASFTLSDADTARYIWKLCVTQHIFFKRYIDEDGADSADGIPISAEASAAIQQSYAGGSVGGGGGGGVVHDFGDSREDLLLEQQRAIYTPVDFQQMRGNVQNSSSIMSSNMSLAASGSHHGGIQHPHALGQSWGNIPQEYAAEYPQQSTSSLSTINNMVQSTSCLDLSNNNLNGSNSINNNHIIDGDTYERERLKAMLPTYRPAPDYETAVQQKYHRASANEIHNLNHQTAVGSTGGIHSDSPHFYTTGSQPDIHNMPSAVGATSSTATAAAAAAVTTTTTNLSTFNSENMIINHLTSHRYPDVAQPAAAAAAAAAAIQKQQQQQQQHLNAVTNSNIYTNIDLAQRLQIMRVKPPPPYPVNRLSSSSTPDLAVASHRPLLGYRAYVSGSSPDLVSNRNFLNLQYPSVVHQYPYMSHIGHSQPYLPHGTFENLNMIEEQPSMMLPHLRQSINNQLYEQQQQQQQQPQSVSAAAAAVQTQANPPQLPPSVYRQQQQQQQANNFTTETSQTPTPLQRNAMNGSIEPIYENVPLPMLPTMYNSSADAHRSSSTSTSSEAMRNRTSSIQSAPGGIHHQTAAIAVQSNPARHLQSSVNNDSDDVANNLQQFNVTGSNSSGGPIDAINKAALLQRNMRATSVQPSSVSVPSVANQPPQRHMTPPPRHQHKTNVISKGNANGRHHDDSSLNHNFNAMMNISSSKSTSAAAPVSFLNTSQSTINTTMNTTGATSMNTTNTSTATNGKEPKRKKRWNILGRSKTPTDKQKSATLGREKTKNQTKSADLAQEEISLRHRWSTGLPKLQPISGNFSKDKLCQILDAKLNDSQLFMEFERIPKRRESARYECALMEENALKNSDPNFLPYDDNRVRITPTMDNRHGYVNASHISATVGNKQRFYIVAQSPLEELTTRIFWQCVWEADVYLIVQLSEDLNYIPPNTNQRLEFGQFQVYQEFSQTTDRCITSKLRLYHIQSRRYRSVWHLNYTDWAEQNCPRDVNHFLDFLEELNSVRLASINEVPPGHNTNPPVLIHCLEGSGRSGVALTADLLLYTLDHNEDLDIPRVIGQLRHQRDNIIPSLAQYKFIYSLLITYLKRTRLI